MTRRIEIASVAPVIQALLVSVVIAVVERRVIDSAAGTVSVGVALLIAANRAARGRRNAGAIPPALTAPFPAMNRMAGAAATERRPAGVAAVRIVSASLCARIKGHPQQHQRRCKR